jgi:hypothetical protein
MLLPFEEEQIRNRGGRLAIAIFLTLADTEVPPSIRRADLAALVGNPLDESPAACSACHMGILLRSPLDTCVPRLLQPQEICFPAIC